MKIKNILLNIAIIVSVFSQIDPISAIARPAMYMSWMLLIGYTVVTTGRSFYISRFTKIFLLCYSLFLIMSTFNRIFLDSNDTANYIRVLLVPLLVSVVGDFFSDMDDNNLQKSLRLYILCSLFYAVWVHRTYFPSYTSWLSTRIYLFTLKNSAAQIWSAALLIGLFLIKYKNKYEKFLGFIICAYLLLLIGISQCRTAILALAVVTVAYAFIKAQRKYLVIFIAMILAAAAWNIPFTRSFINQALFLNKYAGADFNTFSSGRVELWIRALNIFWKSPLIGSGHYYVDCSYILILAESGILGFIIIETVWLNKICTNLKYIGESKISSFLFCITIYYIIESLLEGYPPFGPGVSAFMFWFLSSVFNNQHRRKVSLSE